MGLYLIANGPMQTTAAFAPVTTGTAIKTMMQVKLGASTNNLAKICEWGISFDGSAAATPGRVELITTGTVAGTVTAHAATGIINLEGGSAVTDDFPFGFGTTETGYTCTSEGSITAVRNLDGAQFIAPTTQYQKQFPLGREPRFPASEYMRIRVTFGTAVNCYCYVVIEV